MALFGRRDGRCVSGVLASWGPGSRGLTQGSPVTTGLGCDTSGSQPLSFCFRENKQTNILSGRNECGLLLLPANSAHCPVCKRVSHPAGQPALALCACTGGVSVASPSLSPVMGHRPPFPAKLRTAGAMAGAAGLGRGGPDPGGPLGSSKPVRARSRPGPRAGSRWPGKRAVGVLVGILASLLVFLTFTI